jgi:hypothetical protein
MANYDLSIAFSDDQLATIFATGSKVVIAKPTGSTPNVAWQVFKPFATNGVSWVEQYGIYVSNSEVVNGATLTQLSSTSNAAQMNTLYTMQDSAIIAGPAAGGSLNSFALLNKYSSLPYLTVGLFQDATINGVLVGGNAISAAPTLLQSTATMTPYTTVYVWLQSEIESNTVVSVVTSPMTSFKFGGGINSISCIYDSPTGTFISK